MKHGILGGQLMYNEAHLHDMLGASNQRSMEFWHRSCERAYLFGGLKQGPSKVTKHVLSEFPIWGTRICGEVDSVDSVVGLLCFPPSILLD